MQLSLCSWIWRMSQPGEPGHTAAMDAPHEPLRDVPGLCLNARLYTDVHLVWIDDFDEFARRTGIRRSTEMDLYWAVRQNNVPLVGKMLTQNQSSNAIFRWKVKGGSRDFFQFPLHRAVQTGNPELVELLLQHGSDPNSCDSIGCTPLQLLFLCNMYTNVFRVGPDCCQTYPDIARMLLEGGTRIDKQRFLTPGHQGWNDLHSLCRIGMECYLLNNDDNNIIYWIMMIIMVMMMMIIIMIIMMTMMIIGTATIMIMIIIITTTLTMTIMKMIMIKTAQTPCQSLYKDRRI